MAKNENKNSALIFLLARCAIHLLKIGLRTKNSGHRWSIILPICVNGSEKRWEPVVADFTVSVEEDDYLAGGSNGSVVATPEKRAKFLFRK